MEIDPGCGPRSALMIGAMAVLLIACIAIVIPISNGIQGAREAIANAQADAAWARTRAEEARAEQQEAIARQQEALTARDREGNLHRETMFMAWSIALAHYSSNGQGWLVLLAMALGILCAGYVIRWLDKLFSKP